MGHVIEKQVATEMFSTTTTTTTKTRKKKRERKTLVNHAGVAAALTPYGVHRSGDAVVGADDAAAGDRTRHPMSILYLLYSCYYSSHYEIEKKKSNQFNQLERKGGTDTHPDITKDGRIMNEEEILLFLPAC